jgi:crossover junction endonuclease MUS81
MVRLDPEEFVNIRKVEFLLSQRNHPFAAQLKLVEPTSAGRSSGQQTLIGYILEDGAPPNCSKFDEIQSDAPARPPPRTPLFIDDGDGIVEYDWLDPTDRPSSLAKPSASTRLPLPVPFPAHTSASTFTRTASAPVGPSNPLTPARLAAEAAARRAAQAVTAGPSRTQSATAEFALPSKPRAPAPRLSSHIPLSTPLLDDDDVNTPTDCSVNVPDFTPDNAITYPAGSYEISLILDTREVESKTSRDKFAQALEDKGVRMETRALKLGDVCWIAKRKDGIGGEEDECVLNYVMERKRLDDLCSSIKDGRYTEQCVSGTAL